MGTRIDGPSAAEVNERAELGAVLATARKARSLTQPALSELTGIQQAEISRTERGAGRDAELRRLSRDRMLPVWLVH